MLRATSTLAIMGAIAMAGTSVAEAQTRRAGSTPSTSPMAMDVAGVRLGMPFEQVRAALAGTYRCDVSRNALTFADLVQDEVTKRRGAIPAWREGTGVYGALCKGPNGEDLKVFFAQAESGSVVRRFTLLIPTTGVDRADLLRQLAAKYGKPNRGEMNNGCWIEAGEFCGILTKGPMFTIQDLSTAVSIVGERGKAAENADEAAIAAAADRIAPKKSKAAF